MQQAFRRGAIGRHASHKLAAACLEALEQRQMLTGDVSPITAQYVPGGKSLIVPVTSALEQEEAPETVGKITYAVTSSNPAFKVKLHENNPYLKLTVNWTTSTGTPAGQAGNGTMYFQLLKDLAPETVRYISEMVNAGFYNGLKFHRIDDLSGGKTMHRQWIVQGGDPLGNGQGGPDFRFQDEFSPEAIFDGTGQLAMANSGNDTNGSQFFITLGSPRHLDYNHTIFGQMVRGMDVMGKLTDNTIIPRDIYNKFTATITIDKAELVADNSDGVMTITAPKSGTSTITVTATDSQGHTSDTSFTATAYKDKVNDPPFISPAIKDVITKPGIPVQIPLSAYDAEGNAVQWGGGFIGTQHAYAVLEQNLLTVIPYSGYKGPISLRISAQPQGASATAASDETTIIIGVGAWPIAVKALQVKPVVGQSGQAYTLATFKCDDPKDTKNSYAATVNWGDGTAGPGTILSDGKGGYKVMGVHTYKNEGSYTVDVNVTSKLGATAKATATANVLDAPLTKTNVQVITGSAGVDLGSTTVLGSFKDTDPSGVAADHTVTIDWGDGSSTTPGTISASSIRSGSLDIKGTHTYSTAGTYTIIAHVLGLKTGDSTLDITNTAYISRAGLTVNLGSDVTSGQSEAAQFTRNDLSFTDTDTAAHTYTAQVDYGDGAGLEPLALADGKFSLQHTWDKSGSYKVIVIVSDEAGATGSKVLNVTVGNVAPTVAALTGDATGVRGQPVTLHFSATDPSQVDTAKGFTFKIDWGDGKTETYSGSGGTGATSGSLTHAYTSSAMDDSNTTFAETYTVKVTATDQDYGASAAQQFSMTIKSAMLQTSSLDPNLSDLVVGGTLKADTIDILPADGGQYTVKIAYPIIVSGATKTRTETLGPFNVTGRIRVYGGAGADKITVDPTITRGVELYGEADNDTLVGSLGNDILAGGAGNDSITGGAGRDILLGDAGKDTLDGGADDDMLFAGSLGYESKNAGAGLVAIQKEWLRPRSVANRLRHLATAPGGLNTIYLVNKKTLISDNDVDSLTGGAGDDVFFGRTGTTNPDTFNDNATGESVLPD